MAVGNDEPKEDWRRVELEERYPRLEFSDAPIKRFLLLTPRERTRIRKKSEAS